MKKIIILFVLALSIGIIIYIDRSFIFDKGKVTYKGIITKIVPNNDFLTEKEYSVGTNQGYVFVVEQDDIAKYQIGKCIYIDQITLTNKDRTCMIILAILFVVFLLFIFTWLDKMI